MLISIFSVLFIVFITMMYATSKIRKENIIDALRDDIVQLICGPDISLSGPFFLFDFLCIACLDAAVIRKTQNKTAEKHKTELYTIHIFHNNHLPLTYTRNASCSSPSASL